MKAFSALSGLINRNEQPAHGEAIILQSFLCELAENVKALPMPLFSIDIAAAQARLATMQAIQLAAEG